MNKLLVLTLVFAVMVTMAQSSLTQVASPSLVASAEQSNVETSAFQSWASPVCLWGACTGWGDSINSSQQESSEANTISSRGLVARPSTGWAPLRVRFDRVFKGYSKNARYEMNYGDGTNCSYTLNAITTGDQNKCLVHRYTTPGTYIATLVVFATDSSEPRELGRTTIKVKKPSQGFSDQ